MNRISLRLTLLMAFAFCLFMMPATAQENSEAVIIQKITHEDGSVTIVKKRVPQGADVKALAEEFDTEEGTVEIHITSNEDVELEEMDGETIFMFRQAKKDLEDAEKELESLRVIMHENQDFDFDFDFDFDELHEKGVRNCVPRTRTERATKPFLGIYPDNTDDGVGVLVSGVVSDAGAKEAGIQKGDIIKSLDGNATNGTHGLRATLLKLTPNSTVMAVVVRDGQTLQIPVTLGEKEYNRHVWNEERDPCEVFIGVYVGGRASSGEGVQITGIIGNTPASTYGVESGDVILAMDGVKVNNNKELLIERDKHDAGDPFVLSVLRNDQTMDINARFKSCEEIEEEVEEEAPEEILEDQDQGQGAIQEPILENQIRLNEYSAYPNPTFGNIQIQFDAEPVATEVQISDATGRLVYRNNIKNFQGQFNERINLSEAAPGTLTLTIRQGDQLVSKQIVLLNRA